MDPLKSGAIFKIKNIGILRDAQSHTVMVRVAVLVAKVTENRLEKMALHRTCATSRCQLDFVVVTLAWLPDTLIREISRTFIVNSRCHKWPLRAKSEGLMSGLLKVWWEGRGATS